MEEQNEPVERISAVTLLTGDMGAAVAFYLALGFHLLYGGAAEPFTSFRVGDGYLNLQLDTAASPAEAPSGVESCSGSTTWTRCTDARSRPGSTGNFAHGRAMGRALLPHPRPDGHELSFARPLAPR